MYTKHLLSALLIFPFSLWATGSGSDWTATSALQFQQQSDTQVTVGDNVISFTTSSTERMTLDANGNVGIGTTTPANRLEVFGSSFNRVSAIVDTNVQNGFQIKRTGASFSTDWEIYNPTSSTDLRFYNTGDRLTIKSDGTVGIGTTTPVTNSKLDVIGGIAVGGQRVLDSDANNIMVGDLAIGDGSRGLMLRAGDQDRLYIKEDGNVGIGTTSPFSGTGNLGVHVNRGIQSSLLLGDPKSGHGGIVQTSDGKHRVFIGANLYDDHTGSWSSFQSGKGSAGISLHADEGGWGTEIDFITSQSDGHYNTRMAIIGNGNVGIGTTTPSHKLHVVGNVHASSFSAEPSFVWPDYVFEENYKLSEIEEVEKYIEKNHHLPEIPSAAEVKENGVDIVSMQAKLLQKIEELTLYVIEQNKQIEDLQQQNLQMNKKIQTLVK
ncbi:MAG: hypothetical protein ABJF04_14685 [Reichenbachiella sp.]|uniref:hypothetical protein n=1 Tax=Reichenbachiella sp. TaxID=2184521 RepID=UPI0032640705